MNYQSQKIMNKIVNIRTIVLMLLMLLNFNSFSQISESKMHYIFVIDNTGSMCVKGGGGAQNIWEPVKTKIIETILSLDDNEESVISVYTFASDLKIRNIDGKKGGMAIKEMPINVSTKIDISETIRSINCTGQETCIYKSFKDLISILSANSNSQLKKFNTRIFLFTDSEEDCRTYSEINCNNAFDEWCQIKSDQDFASIIKLEQSDAASTLLSCISDKNCIEVVNEPITQITKVIANDAYIEFNSSNISQTFNYTKSLNININEVNYNTNSSIEIQIDNNNCLFFEDSSRNELKNINVLNQTLVLGGINACELTQGETIEGYIIYDKVLFFNEKIKLILKYPQVKFLYTNDAFPNVEHDYTK